MHGISPVVSVIMPVYNGERFLEECIKSVLNQTFVEFELLIIDDGSTDATPDICRTISDQDQRVKLLKNRGKGVSSARNLGLEHAKGKYITFVDGDDVLLPNALAQMLDLIIKNKAPVIISQYRTFTERFIQKARGGIKPGLYDRAGVDMLRSEMANGHLPTYVWSMMFRKQKFGTVRFRQDISIMEDTVFYMEILELAHKVYVSKEVTYYYRVNTSSLSRSFDQLQATIRDVVRVASILERYVSHKDIPKMNAFRANILANYCVNALIGVNFSTFTRVFKILNKSREYNGLLNSSDMSILPLKHRAVVTSIQKNRYIAALIICTFRAFVYSIKTTINNTRGG